jgi:hypothetical protein
MMQALVQRRCGASSHPHSLATWLHNLGGSYQTARFVSEHLKEANRLAWRRTKGPQILQHARQRKARRLFGDEARCAPWGSRSATWAPTGEQPAVPTSGKRQGYKVFGLLDYCSGRFCYTGACGAV